MLTPDDPRHGTRTGYARHKCQCDRCREANRLYSAQYRGKPTVRQRRAPKPPVAPVVVSRGPSGLTWHRSPFDPDRAREEALKWI